MTIKQAGGALPNPTPVDLDALEQVARAATPGPWLNGEGVSWDDPKYCGYDSVKSGPISLYYATGPEASSSTQAASDAAFIASFNPAVALYLIAELRRLRAAGEWKPLLRDGLLQAEEGRSYLFAVEVDGGWEYFSDSIGWDADEETVPAWHDGGHGWSIERVTHFAPLPLPPVEGT